MRAIAVSIFIAASTSHIAVANVPTAVSLPPVNVKLPVSTGWEMLRNNGSNLVMRRDDGAIAYVAVGRWPPPKTDAEFVKHMRTNVQELAGSIPGAEIVDATYVAARDRPYPCMRARFRARAKPTGASLAKESSPDMQYRILACHSLDKQLHAFFAGYSFFSADGAENPQQESEAESFLRGTTMESRRDAKGKK